LHFLDDASLYLKPHPAAIMKEYKTMKKCLIHWAMLGCGILFLLQSPVSARGRGGAVLIAPGFGFGYYDPFWGTYPYDGYAYANSGGTVKFDTQNRDAAVFIDGGYAGTVGKLKSLHLRPGTYNVELRTQGATPYTEKVYVAAGKTVHINPNLNRP
jgi:PEGA domain